MSIVAVDCFVLKVAHDEPYLGEVGSPDTGYQVRAPWRSIYSRRFETLLVRLTADDGTTGWGEALSPVAPEVPAEIVRRLLAPVLVGADPSRIRPLVAKLRDLMRERGHLGGYQADAIAAVDIALWDLAGKLAGLPVHALLGGAFHDWIPTYVSGLTAPDDAGRAEQAATWQRHGVRTIKLHLGRGLESDLATLDAVRTAAPEVRFAVDAHWAYSLPQAIRLARELAAREVVFLEAPLAPEDLAGHAELCGRSEIPIAVGETLRHRYETTPWLAGRAAGILQPDVARTGLTEGLAIAELASAHHLPVAPHHSVGFAVALAAGLHLSAAAGNLLLFEYQPVSTQVGQRILTKPVPGGAEGFPVPDAPGLGIDVDEQAVARLAESSTEGEA
ncbi:mandelate racemase/muconate lactonizing enzyme family protein [Actinopolymorpha alba]|uniref:mandelate racemase/muconate lactonizing enzyme family protein n=1 Tax=Actinopolymorpha alba TaxID=533267 RepID=UPI0003614DEA|nr:mandelate racemase/muconate lactonizing enzyme family protein [Actinopolymorpha alba]